MSIEKCILANLVRQLDMILCTVKKLLYIYRHYDKVFEVVFAVADYCSELMATHKLKAMATQVSKSAAEEALEKLANQLTCSVCLEEYTRPRVLPCLHIFCEACLQKVVVAQANRLTATCPNCRQASQLPGEGVSTLPSAFLIQNLFEVRDTREGARPKEGEM